MVLALKNFAPLGGLLCCLQGLPLFGVCLSRLLVSTGGSFSLVILNQVVMLEFLRWLHLHVLVLFTFDRNLCVAPICFVELVLLSLLKPAIGRFVA